MNPDLAVEVLSSCNTPAEMARKRGEYFRSGVREVWEIDPESREFKVYTDEHSFRLLAPKEDLTTAVLPGFTLNMVDLFSVLDRLNQPD